MRTFQWHLNRYTNKAVPYTEFTQDVAKQARHYHGSMPGYDMTPLADLSHLAKTFGVAGVYVKDESHRFNLNAFKALGASYALGKLVEKKLLKAGESLDFAMVLAALERFKHESGKPMTFVTATDGNHGRGLAWAAAQLGQASVVLMPKGSSAERLQNIQREGAEAFITEWNYDDAVREAKRLAAERGWHLVQDTVLPDYEEVPKWIMMGYMTLGIEVLEQMAHGDGKAGITHVFLQAGVGSMAAAMAALMVQTLDPPPKIIIVESDQADCFYRTAVAEDAELHLVTGDMNTIMAGLACGEPNPIAWEILKDYADAFISCSDEVAATGMRILASPRDNDAKVISGESGAVGMGVLYELVKRPELSSLKQALAIDETSKVLLISTEGDTDREMYRRIVWEGLLPRG